MRALRAIGTTLAVLLACLCFYQFLEVSDESFWFSIHQLLGFAGWTWIAAIAVGE